MNTNIDNFISQSRPFIEWMLEWKDGLAPLSIQEILSDGADKVGVVSVDVINGFCNFGPLSSPRVKNIIDPIAELFSLAWENGVRDIALPQDAHPENAVEFGNYAIHCIRGTPEADTVDEFKNLSFFDQIAVFEKNSISAGLAPSFNEWFQARSHIKNWIIVGDCTDLCTHQLAMYVRLSANQNQQSGVRVILPVNAVDTYDLPVNVAEEIGAIPHDGEFMHVVFLYQMMLNGVEIVSEITG